MPKPLSQEKRLEWDALFRKQRESGLAANRWCRENQISMHSFYYWKRRLGSRRPATLSRDSFSELKEAVHDTKCGLVLEYRGVLIRLDDHFEPSVLQRCLAVLKEVPC